jgi:hypothetical protein
MSALRKLAALTAFKRRVGSSLQHNLANVW